VVGVFWFIPRSYLIHASLSCPVGDNLTSLPGAESAKKRKRELLSCFYSSSASSANSLR
jgi:hypothetical protein